MARVLLDVRAQKQAQDLGHALSDFQPNGDHIIARCLKCLCLVIGDYKEDRIFGVASEQPCEAASVEKDLQFPHALMGVEYRARLEAPWKPPSEKG